MPTALRPAFVAVLVAALQAPAHAQVLEIRKIADTATSGPSGTLSTFSTPSIKTGKVVFSAVSGGNLGVFLHDGSALSTVVKQGDAAPSGTFTGFSPPTTDGAHVAFEGIYPSGRALFTAQSGILTTIVKTGDPVPCGGTLVNTGINFPSEVPVSGGIVAFRGVSSGGDCLYRGSGGALTIVAADGDPAPDMSFFNGFSGSAIDGDSIAFIGHYLFASNQPGVFRREISGGGAVIAPYLGPAPPGGVFGSFRFPSVSGRTVAFIANGSFSGSGLFAGDGGPLTTIARTFTAVPGGTLSTFGTGGDQAISGSRVAFVGTLNGTPSARLFVGDGGPLVTVIATGDALFGSTVTGLDIGRFGFDGDEIAFSYTLAGGAKGIAVARLTPAPAPVVTLAAIDALAAEAGADPATFRFTRSGSTVAALTVSYTIATGPGQATSGDYTPALTGSVIIPSGLSSVDVAITPVADGTPEPNESLALTLAAAAAYTIGSPSAALVTIVDADGGGPPSVAVPLLPGWAWVALVGALLAAARAAARRKHLD